MLRTYFDTNVYGAIDEGSIPSGETAAVRAALASREIIASMSLADVEELLGDWQTNRSAALRRLRVARDLVGFDGMLKQPADLLREAIEAYAVGVVQPPPILPRHPRRVVAVCLGKIADGSARFESVVTQIIADVKAQKVAFKTAMGQGRAEALGELSRKYDQHVLRQVPFKEFWAGDAALWAEAFAADVGLADACRERGLDGLLEVRTVRLYVGTAKSLVYAQVVEGRQPDLGDGYDLWHAILASVADVFVTFDKRLADHVARVPTDGFRVVRSLRELLALL